MDSLFPQRHFIHLDFFTFLEIEYRWQRTLKAVSVEISSINAPDRSSAVRMKGYRQGRNDSVLAHVASIVSRTCLWDVARDDTVPATMAVGVCAETTCLNPILPVPSIIVAIVPPSSCVNFQYIMTIFSSMFSASRCSPDPHPSRRDSRSVGCTHLQVTRIYDKYGALKCPLCLKHPSFGWLYRCTQDSHGLLPESDFLAFRRRDKRKTIMDPTLHNLSPSIVRAIIEGQYTEDQIKVLVQQKENVRLSILGQESCTRPTTSASAATSTATESTCHTHSGLPESTTFTSDTSVTSLDEELKAAYDWAELQKVWLSEPSHPMGQRSAIDLDREEALQSIDPPEMAPCTLKVCHACRPNYKDRAWQSIDEVLKNPIMPPKWEFDNRLVSDVRIVRALGLPKPKRYYSDPSLDIDTGIETPGIVEPDDTSEVEVQHESQGDINDHSIRAKSGFRNAVRSLVKGAKPADKQSFDEPDDTPPHFTNNTNNCNGSPQSPISRSMLFLRRKSRPSIPRISLGERRASVVGNSSLNESLMLMLAANTPLPTAPRTPEIETYRKSTDDPFAITETSSTPDEMMEIRGLKEPSEH
jgi:hypothetical protein